MDIQQDAGLNIWAESEGLLPFGSEKSSNPLQRARAKQKTSKMLALNNWAESEGL